MYLEAFSWRIIPMQLISVIFVFAVTGQRIPRLGEPVPSGPGINALPVLGSLPSFDSIPGAKWLPSLGGNPFDAMSIGRKFIAGLLPNGVPLFMDSLTSAPAVPRSPPGRIPVASIEDVKKNFINAYMPFCPDSNGVECICKQTYPHVEYIEDKGAQTLVVVAINAKFNQIVVSYRITANLQNWLDTLRMQFADMPKGARVHQGIYSDLMATYDKVQASVNTLLNNPSYRNHSLFITGYSLGGGMAQLSIPSWHSLIKNRKDPRPIEVISYSNPRVGNKAFADYIESLNIPVTRYTNQNDLISHLPSRKLGYVHAGAEVYGFRLNTKYTLRHCSQEYDEDPTCIMGSFDTKSPFFHAYPFGKFIPLPPYC